MERKWTVHEWAVSNPTPSFVYWAHGWHEWGMLVPFQVLLEGGGDCVYILRIPAHALSTLTLGFCSLNTIPLSRIWESCTWWVVIGHVRMFWGDFTRSLCHVRGGASQPKLEPIPEHKGLHELHAWACTAWMNSLGRDFVIWEMEGSLVLRIWFHLETCHFNPICVAIQWRNFWWQKYACMR